MNSSSAYSLAINLSHEYEEHCEQFAIPYLDLKFWLVAVIGTCISLLSLLENSILVMVFLWRPALRQTHFYYMCWMAGR